MEQNRTERKDTTKKEQEQNDLSEGPHSRTERNDFKKSERAQPYLDPSGSRLGPKTMFLF